MSYVQRNTFRLLGSQSQPSRRYWATLNEICVTRYVIKQSFSIWPKVAMNKSVCCKHHVQTRCFSDFSYDSSTSSRDVRICVMSAVSPDTTVFACSPTSKTQGVSNVVKVVRQSFVTCGWNNTRVSFRSHDLNSGDQVKKTEMGRTCSTYGGEQRCVQGFSGKTWRKETIWKTQA